MALGMRVRLKRPASSSRLGALLVLLLASSRAPFRDHRARDGAVDALAPWNPAPPSSYVRRRHRPDGPVRTSLSPSGPSSTRRWGFASSSKASFASRKRKRGRKAVSPRRSSPPSVVPRSDHGLLDGSPSVPDPADPLRISSREASDWIRTGGRRNGREGNDGGGLLVITCDASGCGKHSGLAAVLRRCNGVGGNDGGDDDEVRIVTRRISGERTTNAEIAAVALGVRTALAVVPAWDRRAVLILTDCDGALNFYGRGTPGPGCVPRRCRRAARYRREMERLSVEADRGGAGLAKVRSATQWVGKDGFFDHAVADAFSAPARFKTNAEQVYEVIKSAPGLRGEDLDWLERSEVPMAGNGGGTGTGIRDRVEGRRRKGRCRDRIKRDLGIALP